MDFLFASILFYYSYEAYNNIRFLSLALYSQAVFLCRFRTPPFKVIKTILHIFHRKQSFPKIKNYLHARLPSHVMLAKFIKALLKKKKHHFYNNQNNNHHCL